MSPSETISPTAHYTGYVWARNGLSHPKLETLEGRVLFESLRPVITVSQRLGGASLENYLLARHRAIDALLERAIEDGVVTQIVEVACGLSPRGWRFSSRYGDRITYVETDLPAMAERKRRALRQMSSLNEHHRVEDVDALRNQGPGSLAALCSSLDADRATAIITEGLLGYLDSDTVDALWRRFAQALSGFAAGLYISDVHLGDLQTIQVRIFRLVLSAFVRGRVHLHFETASEGKAALVRCGFHSAAVRRASALAPGVAGPGSDMAHILEASTT